MPKLEDLTGQVFGKLTVMSYDGNQRWICICECGTVKSIRARSLKSGSTKSCGCTNAQHYKICTECGKQFPCSPSDKTVTCSPKCKSIRRSRLLKGHSMSDDACAKISAKAKTQNRSSNLSKGTPAALQSPKAGRFTTNSSAKHWTLLSPDGMMYKCSNLSEFIRVHADLFGIRSDDDVAVHRIFASFAQLKIGLRKGTRSYCNEGWKLLLQSEEDDIKNCERKTED